MSAWLTTAELAALAFPGMPASQRGWNDFAEREGWAGSGRARLRAGRGGGIEYRLDLLPAAAQAHVAARAVAAAGSVVVAGEQALAAALAPQAASLGAGAQESRDARLALLAAAGRFAADGVLSRQSADAAFAQLYNAGAIDAAGWIKAAVRRLAPRTLARWRAHAARGDMSRLGVDRGAARRGKGLLASAGNGAVSGYILALVAHQPHLSAEHVRALTGETFPALALPPARTFQHFLKGLKASEKILLALVTNPDAFKSRYRVSGTNSHAVSRLNELWMIDASPVDALCRDGRHAVYVCIDIFSRRLIVLVARTARAEAVALLIRLAILAWGVPERVKTDNGSDFRARATQRMFAALGIETEAAAPFSPEQKGHVERAIGTLQRDLMPLLPGFIGHSVKDRKIIEERKAFSARLGEDDARAFCVDLSPAELQDYCDRWARDKYAHRAHDGLKGATPFAQAASWGGALRRIENIRALDLLLAPVAGGNGLRKVTKTGIRIDGSIYLCPAAMPGSDVLVRMDPADMGRAHVFAADGESWIGEAVCPELAGVDPAAAVMAAKAEQKRLLDAGAKELRAGMRAIKPRHMVEAVLGRAAREAGNLVAFPRRAEAHETPALAAAAAALADAPAAAPDRLRAMPALAPAASVTMLPETKQQRFRRARALERDVAAGLCVATAAALWLGGYQASAEYRALAAMFEDFGEAALM